MERDIIERLMDFEHCGLTALDRVNMRECAAIEIHRLRAENEALKAADRDHLSAKNGMELRMNAQIDRLMEENRRLRELPEEPGPRYESGEYSRRNHEAMIADALGLSRSP